MQMQEILELIGQGMAKKEIASHLKISITTVAYHVQHVYEKLEVPNAPAAVDTNYHAHADAVIKAIAASFDR